LIRLRHCIKRTQSDGDCGRRTRRTDEQSSLIRNAKCRRLDGRPRPVASSVRRAPPPAFPFPKPTMSKSWFKIRNLRSDPNPPRRPLRGPPGVGSAVSIGPLTPCQRPASDFYSRFVSPVWRATAFRPGAQLTAADVFRLTRGGGFYGTVTHVSTAYFVTCCKTPERALLQSIKLRGSAVGAAFASPVLRGKDA